VAEIIFLNTGREKQCHAYNALPFMYFVHRLVLWKSIAFRILDLFCSQAKKLGGTHSAGTVKKTNSVSEHVRKEMHSVLEMRSVQNDIQRPKSWKFKCIN
jgi:hypothetical protein